MRSEARSEEPWIDESKLKIEDDTSRSLKAVTEADFLKIRLVFQVAEWTQHSINEEHRNGKVF